MEQIKTNSRTSKILCNLIDNYCRSLLVFLYRTKNLVLLIRYSNNYFRFSIKDAIPMITITYDEVFTFENLYEAHIKNRCARRSKKPIVKFEINMLSHIFDLYRRLQSGKF